MAEPCCDHGYREMPDGSQAPCSIHLPNVFARWSGGHLASDHDPEGCQGCRDASKGRLQRGVARPARR